MPKRGPATRRRPGLRRSTAAALLFVLTATACSSGDSAGEDRPDTDAASSTLDAATAPGQDVGALPDAYIGYASDVYSDDAHWLCRPGIEDNVCDRNLDTTVIAADGSTELRRAEVPAKPPVDCFYVYPTASGDQAVNSDLVPAEEDEIFVAYNQAAPYSEACRVFAPVYRQRTLPALVGVVEVPDDSDAHAVAYSDVLDAFRHYMANDNRGRGVVLVGHSQGTGMLRQLIAEEIDPTPSLRNRLVAAHLLGGSIEVPAAQTVGGSFANTPLCSDGDESGCVVTYASYRYTAPPPNNSIFGRAEEPNRAGCVNPADPGAPDEALPLESRFLLNGSDGTRNGGTQPFEDDDRSLQITTPWITFEDLVSARCAETNGATYLELSITGDGPGPRSDDIGGDLLPTWGMHLVDINVASGDLVRLAKAQSANWLDR